MNLAIQICKASEAAELVTFKEKEGVPFHAVISIEHPSLPLFVRRFRNERSRFAEPD